MKQGEAAGLLDAVGQSGNYVAAMTGIKQLFIDAGWHERAAEQMVYAMMMQNAGGAR